MSASFVRTATTSMPKLSAKAYQTSVRHLKSTPERIAASLPKQRRSIATTAVASAVSSTSASASSSSASSSSPPTSSSSFTPTSGINDIEAFAPKRIPEFSLKDKVILLSGAARGLGLTTAEALLEAGAKVYGLDRLPEPSPDFYRVQKRAEKELGTEFHYAQIDVRDVENLNAIIGGIATKEGRLDGLLAAAGVQQETSALEYTAQDANTMFEINITGVLMTAQAAAKQMIRFGNGGSIAIIASMSGTVVNKGLICSAYNASKSGVLQLSRSLAAEWGEHGIRVNTISPGYIVTAMVEQLFIKYPERRAQWAKENMLGRLSSPEEYRGAAVFLLSNASSFVTASDLRIDGGHAAW